MARTTQQILEQLLGAKDVQIASLTAQLEALQADHAATKKPTLVPPMSTTQERTAGE